jgi:hypothetical protein
MVMVTRARRRAAEAAEHRAEQLPPRWRVYLDHPTRLFMGVSITTRRAPMDYNGRYEGRDGEFTLLLRVDIGGFGIVSADLFRGTDYLTSTRTLPGQWVGSATGCWAAQFSADRPTTGSGTVPGTITITPVDDRLTVTVRPDLAVAGLAAGQEATVTVDRLGPELREFGLETETEAGVEPPNPVVFDAKLVDERECLRRAGFAIRTTGQPTRIPRQDQRWDYSRLFTLLHDLMTDTAQADLSVAAWQQQLLLLSASTRPGLAGIMFDAAGLLPRQGCAVFMDAVRAHAAGQNEDPDRNAIRTIVHELGHSLNLAHRFEEAVGHPGSTSFMNYPQRFQPGGSAAYWPAFRFLFDADEREFLQHAPLGAVRPGDAAFHSVVYWAGQGWLPPPVPPPGSVLNLALTAPPAGTTFTVGQPVFLEVVLQNLGDEPVAFDIEPLDLKTGPLRIFVRRKPVAGEPEEEEFRPFVPLVMGCVQPAAGPVTLPAHDLRTNNLNLGYGAHGASFPEPGVYQVAPVLFLEEPWGQVFTDLLEIRVAPDPAGDADTLLRPDVGAWFALGGSDALATAGELLEQVRVRRLARNGAADPVVAAIVRAAGINAGRRVTRFQRGQFRDRAGDPVRAEVLLGSLDAAALRTFDPHTAAGTARLAARYASMNRG